MGVDDAVVFEELPQIKIKFRESKVFKPIIDDIHQKLIGHADIDLKKQMAKVEIELIGTDVTELFNEISKKGI